MVMDANRFMCKLFTGSWQCGVDKNSVILGKTVCRLLSFTSDFACKSVLTSTSIDGL